MKRWKKSSRRLALGLCAMAVVVPTAQAVNRPDNRAVGPRAGVTHQDFWNYDATGKKIANSSPGVAPNELAQRFAGSTVPTGFGTDPKLIQRHNALAKLPDSSDVSSYYTPAAIKAMGDRYNAEAALFAPLPAHVQDLEALNESYQQHTGSAVRPDDRAGIRGVEQQPQTVYATGATQGSAPSARSGPPSSRA